MKRMSQRSIIYTLLLSLLLSLTTSAIPLVLADDPEAIKVWVRAQSEDGFIIGRTELEVTPGLAYAYGYLASDQYDYVTALDVLVAAHVLYYDDDELEIAEALEVSYGSVTTMFSLDSEYYYVTLGDTFWNNETEDAVDWPDEVHNGDTISFGALRDDDFWGLGNYTSWFQYNGHQVTSITAYAGRPVLLQLWGYMMLYAMYNEFPDNEPISEADIYLMTLDQAHFGAVDFTASGSLEQIATADEDGEFSVTFAAPGTYYLTAIESDEWAYYDELLIYPWLEIIVKPAPICVKVR